MRTTTIKTSISRKQTTEKYYYFLVDVYDVVTKTGIYPRREITIKHKVSNGLMTNILEMGIVKRQEKNGAYQWMAAKPTLTMANKLREYNNDKIRALLKEKNSRNNESQLQIEYTPDPIEVKSDFPHIKTPNQPLLVTEKRPFLLVKIGRLEIKF